MITTTIKKLIINPQRQQQGKERTLSGDESRNGRTASSEGRPCPGAVIT